MANHEIMHSSTSSNINYVHSTRDKAGHIQKPVLQSLPIPQLSINSKNKDPFRLMPLWPLVFLLFNFDYIAITYATVFRHAISYKSGLPWLLCASFNLNFSSCHLVVNVVLEKRLSISHPSTII